MGEDMCIHVDKMRMLNTDAQTKYIDIAIFILYMYNVFFLKNIRVHITHIYMRIRKIQTQKPMYIHTCMLGHKKTAKQHVTPTPTHEYVYTHESYTANKNTSTSQESGQTGFLVRQKVQNLHVFPDLMRDLMVTNLEFGVRRSTCLHCKRSVDSRSMVSLWYMLSYGASQSAHGGSDVR